MKKVISIFLLIICFLPGTIVYASFTNGTGGGNGDGTGSSHNPPMVHYTVVKGGREDMLPSSDIIIAFTTNVVNFKVKDSNEKCFKLYDSNASEVPISVIMGDDQVDRTIRKLVTIDPQSDLVEGETYSVHIDKSLKSKNGISMDSDISIDFKVGKGEDTGDALADIMDLTPESTIDLNESMKPENNNSSISTILMVAALIIIVTALVGIVRFARGRV